MAVLTAALALAMTGCAGESGGEDVATAGGTPTATATAGAEDVQTGDMAEQMRKFAACMRENGIDMPDPEVDGEGRVVMRGPGGGGGPEPDREKVEAAQQACKKYLPNGGEPPKLSAEDMEKARQHSKCMRENGVPNFPDPQPDGGMQIQVGPGTGIDPQSQEFKDAQKKCEQFSPRRGPGSS
jgi:hypothetical protein